MTEELIIDRTFDASPDRVWRALTMPDALSEWYWPFPMKARVDGRPGGAYQLDAPGVGMAMEGEITRFEAPRTLGLIWRWAGEPEQTDVTIDVAPAGDGARVQVRHVGFALATTRDDHITGWNDCLDRLPGWLAKSA